MLSHSIIVAPPPTSVLPFPSSAPPWSHEKQYTTQDDLDYHLKLYNFNVGDIVCFSSYNPGSMLTIFQLHVVLAKHDKIEGMVWRQNNGMPMTLLLSQIHLSSTNMSPWIRWDDAASYRRLTKEEYAQLVEKDYDLTQYLIHERRGQAKNTYPTYFTE